MKKNLYLAALAASLVLSVCGCASTDDNRPIPGTPESMDTKKSEAQNNTPRTNPTPNPAPDTTPTDSSTQVIVTH